MYRQIITLIPNKDYDVWCDGRLVVLRNTQNGNLIFYKDTSEVKKEFKAGKDDLVGINLRGG